MQRTTATFSGRRMQGSLSHHCELPLQVGPDCSGGATFRTLLLVGLPCAKCRARTSARTTDAEQVPVQGEAAQHPAVRVRPIAHPHKASRLGVQSGLAVELQRSQSLVGLLIPALPGHIQTTRLLRSGDGHAHARSPHASPALSTTTAPNSRRPTTRFPLCPCSVRSRLSLARPQSPTPCHHHAP